jgi:hypothetical protein
MLHTRNKILYEHNDVSNVSIEKIWPTQMLISVAKTLTLSKLPHKLMDKFRKVYGKYNCSHNETATLEARDKQMKLNTATVTRSILIKVTNPKSEILSNSPH